MDLIIDDENGLIDDNPEANEHPARKNDILNKSQMIFMPFLEDVLNTDGESLKRNDS